MTSNDVNKKGNDTIDHQNSEAIQSIIAVGSTVPTNSTPLNKADLKKCLNVNTDNPDIILFDGSLDNYMKSAQSNNLLMVQPSVNEKIQIASTPAKSHLTEADIINMPTVILCENKIVDAPFVQTSTRTEIVSTSLAVSNSTNNLGNEKEEYITMYKATSSPKLKNLTVDVVAPYDPLKNARSQLEILAKDLVITKPVKLDIIPSTTMNDLLQKCNSTVTTTATICKETITKASDVASKVTPTPQDNNKISLKLNSTPKSSESHVRVLDFNFISPTKNNVESKPKIKNLGMWDQDLRACAISTTTTQTLYTPKSDNSKKNFKKKANKRNDKKKVDEKTGEKEEKKEEAKGKGDKENIKNKKDKKNKKKTEKEQMKQEDKEENVEKAKEVVEEKTTQVKTENGSPTRKSPRLSPKKCQSTTTNDDTNKALPVETNKSPHQQEPNRKVNAATAYIKGSTDKKLILSPSKLNANKRTLMEVETQETKNTNPLYSLEPNTIFGMNVQDADDAEKSNQTPEMETKITSAPHQIVSKRNISFQLTTPVKSEASMSIPRTPGLFSPLNVADTPITRVLKEQMKNIDLNDIQTPKFPLTPLVPVTPMIEDANFPSRPTDYSTSSSYYQPSDTEENKYLEMKIKQECNKKINDQVDKLIAERMKSMTRTATKNLSLVKNNVKEFTSSDSEFENDFESSSSVHPDDSDFVCSENNGNTTTTSSTEDSPNRTVIHEPQIIGGYCLRSRNTPKPETKERVLRHSDVQEKAKGNYHQTILKEMEEKRQKTIMNMMKATNRRTRRTTKKTPGNEVKKPLKKKVAPHQHTNARTSFYSDDERIQPFEVVETKLVESSTDVEAEKMLSGLKEMGIHLIRKGKQIRKPQEVNKKPKEVIKKPEINKNKKPQESNKKTQEVKKPSDLANKSKSRRKPEKPVKKLENKERPRSKSPTPGPPTTILLQNEKRAIDDDLRLSLPIGELREGSVEKPVDVIDINLNTSDVPIFDERTYEFETLHIVYDEKEQPTKTIDDYDLECIERGISATISLDAGYEIEKVMLPTSFDLIFEHPRPEKKPTGKETKSEKR